MTESEANTILKAEIVHHPEHSIFAEALGLAIQALEEVQLYRTIGTLEELQDMKSNYFEALSDWRQYRKIGTLEECRTAREKQTPKKPIVNDDLQIACPNCSATLIYCLHTSEIDYCDKCGQRLDWSEEYA